jgi:organic radical activating enzyme
MERLRVNEIFGPTIQGEGSAAGQHCMFVRLADCNLNCYWCDTPYTWAYTTKKADQHKDGLVYDRSKESKEMMVNEVFDELTRLYPKPTMVVWSGGEPLMQQKPLELAADLLQLRGYHNHVETAGTIAPHDHLVRVIRQFNVSPKLSHSWNRKSIAYKPKVLRRFVETNKAWFKFVVESEDQLGEVDEMVLECKIPRDRVQIMPEGTDPTVITVRATTLAPAVLRRGYGLTLRQHVLMWGDKRGV